MPYTPPGVQTTVVIDSTTVTLPGGTRILSLIGNAKRTKSVSGEVQIQPVNRQVTLNYSGVNTVSRVYDYSGPGSSLYIYPTSGAGLYGSGYYLSGDTILWTPAANAYPTSTTPAIGASFFVTYSGQGTSGVVAGPVTDTLTQNSGHENVLSSGIGASGGYVVLGVSGTAGNYPESGTVTGTDVAGYSIDESGYYLTSSGTLAWNPVNPSTYAYPSAPNASVPTVAPVSGTFYIDYVYNKQTQDYNAKNFVAFNRVVDEYGAEATWSLVTSGTNRGSYILTAINPLTLASKISFQNNASLLVLVQNEGAGTTAGDFLDSLEKLETRTVDIIVPLTMGSGLSVVTQTGNYAANAMTVDQRALALNYTKLHCETMSNEVNKKERVSIGSLGRANVGDVDTADTYIYTAQTGLDSKRIAINAPGLCDVQLQDPAGVFQNVTIDGSFLSAAVASLSVSPLNDVATPLTNKELIGFTNINAESDDHPSTEYLVTEMNNLAAAGVMVIAKEGPRIFVRHQLTTDQSNVVNGEFSVVTLIDYVSQAVRYSCNGFIGKKLKPATTIPAVKGTILATLQTLAQNDIISSIGGITVTINPLNPTELLVEAAYVPIFPLNRIKVNFTIKTLG
jgi:hypothetical protein